MVIGPPEDFHFWKPDLSTACNVTLKAASHRIRLRLTIRLWPTAVFPYAARTPSPTTPAIRLT